MRARAKSAFIGAAAGAGLLALTWFVALHTAVGEHADRAVLRGFVGLQRPRVNTLAKTIADLCDPKPFFVVAIALFLLALARRRPRIALTIAAILLCANATTELLKPLVSTARVLPVSPHPTQSWPSGHATAAMSLALCAILVTPARLRPIVAVVAAMASVAVSYSVMTLGWHYPSDVVGAFFVAGTWTLLAVGVLFWVETRHRVSGRTESSTRPSLRAALTAPAAGCVVAAVFVGLVLLIHPSEALAYAKVHEAFVIGAVAIGALGLALATALVLGVRRSPGRSEEPSAPFAR